MTRFVLVPGACHGGWWYDPLVEVLARDGHDARALTLAGLGPEGRGVGGLGPGGLRFGPPVNLDTHVRETVEAVREVAGDAVPVVLVGHSYGGSVITGAADQVPGLVAGLVCLDAFVPGDGDSCFAMTDDAQRSWYVEGAARTGVAVDPLPFFEERARPHPLAAFVQASRLTGAWRGVRVKHYAAATDWPDGSPFAPTTARLRGDPGFTVHTWPTRHNVLHDGPERVRRLLVEVAAECAALVGRTPGAG